MKRFLVLSVSLAAASLCCEVMAGPQQVSGKQQSLVGTIIEVVMPGDSQAPPAPGTIGEQQPPSSPKLPPEQQQTPSSPKIPPQQEQTPSSPKIPPQQEQTPSSPKIPPQQEQTPSAPKVPPTQEETSAPPKLPLAQEETPDAPAVPLAQAETPAAKGLGKLGKGMPAAPACSGTIKVRPLDSQQVQTQQSTPQQQGPPIQGIVIFQIDGQTVITGGGAATGQFPGQTPPTSPKRLGKGKPPIYGKPPVYGKGPVQADGTAPPATTLGQLSVGQMVNVVYVLEPLPAPDVPTGQFSSPKVKPQPEQFPPVQQGSPKGSVPPKGGKPPVDEQPSQVYRAISVQILTPARKF